MKAPKGCGLGLWVGVSLFWLSLHACGAFLSQTNTPATDELDFIIDNYRYTWYMKPNSASYQTNSYGLRGREFPLKKPPGSLRVICIGDSVTYGAGVELADTFEQQLERKLKTVRLSAEVINAGIGSQCAWQGLERLKKDVVRFDPDIVTICFGLNDGVLKPQTLWEDWREKQLAQRASGAPDQPTHSTSERPAPVPEDDLTPNVPIEEYGTHLKAIARQLQATTHARIYFVTFNPISNDYRKDWSPETRARQRDVYSHYRERMLTVARGLKVTAVDVYSRFAQSKDSLLLSDGIHPNPRGMAVYADEIYKGIASEASEVAPPHLSLGAFATASAMCGTRKVFGISPLCCGFEGVSLLRSR